MTRSLALSFVLATSVAALAGCKSRPAEATPAQRAQASDAMAACTQTFVRQRECTDTFLPALVDTRARLDKPAGIAEQVKTDRAGVIAEAMTEWAVDSTDEAIAQTCARLTATVDANEAAAAQACLAATDCAAFTTCMMPIVERHL